MNANKSYKPPTTVKNSLGSGRSSVMSALSKAATKYRNSKRNSQSFIESIAKREYINNSLDFKKLQYTTINVNKDDKNQSIKKPVEKDRFKSFLSKFNK